jgi:tRNA threonylcarbamoyladenosine modification (KEOPS) complex  Pcc1 subunit
MNAEKVTVKIVVESLDIAILRGMLSSVLEQVEYGAETGNLQMTDGDSVSWQTTRKSVEF